MSYPCGYREKRSLKVLTIIPTLRDFPYDTFNSVLEQTVKTDIIIVSGTRDLEVPPHFKGLFTFVYSKPDLSKTKGFRVAVALNRALEGVDLGEYAWLLKIDGDAVIPPHFLEENIRADYDLQGRGMALVIRVSKFQELMGGEFFVCNADDTYVYAVFLKMEAKVLKWRWTHPPLNGKISPVQNERGRFLSAFDVALMGRPIWWKTLVTDPVTLLGYIYGQFYPFKLPIYYRKKS